MLFQSCSDCCSERKVRSLVCRRSSGRKNKGHSLLNDQVGNDLGISASRRTILLAASLAAVTLPIFNATSFGQAEAGAPVTTAANERTELPDTPGYGPTLALPDGEPGAADPRAAFQARTRTTSPLDKFIDPDELAPRQRPGDKVLMGFRSVVTPFSVIGWFAAAGYSQGTNGRPNYGQTFTGFGQRLGANAARAASEDIFTDSVFAPLLHEDPRYYQMGSGHNPAVRVGYAVTRVFITRTDAGHPTPNLALLGGNLAGAALTQTYYPPINRGFDQTAQTFGTSLGGSALGFALSEFFSGAADRLLHLKRPE